MVYLVYSSNLNFDGVYEDESEAHMMCISKNINLDKVLWNVVDLTYFKKELTKLDYTEEDSEMDESYYLDKIKELTDSIHFEKVKYNISKIVTTNQHNIIKKLNDRIYELTDIIDIEKVQYRKLETFTTSFILTLFTFAVCVYLLVRYVNP